jgi:hypothetical protein
MRITLAIDDDVLAAAKEIAAAEQKSVGRGSRPWLAKA